MSARVCSTSKGMLTTLYPLFNDIKENQRPRHLRLPRSRHCISAHDGPSPTVIVVSVAHPPLPCLWLLNTPEISLLGKLVQLQGVETQSKTCSAANIHGNRKSHQEKNPPFVDDVPHPSGIYLFIAIFPMSGSTTHIHNHQK